MPERSAVWAASQVRTSLFICLQCITDTLTLPLEGLHRDG
jgi:hypothetical protein